MFYRSPLSRGDADRQRGRKKDIVNIFTLSAIATFPKKGKDVLIIIVLEIIFCKNLFRTVSPREGKCQRQKSKKRRNYEIRTDKKNNTKTKTQCNS